MKMTKVTELLSNKHGLNLLCYLGARIKQWQSQASFAPLVSWPSLLQLGLNNVAQWVSLKEIWAS